MNHSKNNQTLARARREDLVVQETPDEVLIYDLKNHKAHCLNETAAFVWNHCDGQTSGTELAALMAKQWNKPVDEGVVWLALKQLSRAELLEERVVPNGDAMRASRRAVLRKLGAAAMTPLVISLVAPTASAGASVPPVCQTCLKKTASSGNCGVCGPITGGCFSNSGCGCGQFSGCTTCSTCLDGGTPAGIGSVSWSTPVSCPAGTCP